MAPAIHMFSSEKLASPPADDSYQCWGYFGRFSVEMWDGESMKNDCCVKRAVVSLCLFCGG